MIHITERQGEVLGTDGHALITGGPGSGKTTVAILKAAKIVKEQLGYSQSVLFLSFARATVSRVLEAIRTERELFAELGSRLEVETYHAFFWRLIRTHGYLLGLPRRLTILAPHNEAAALSALRNEFKPDNKLSPAERTEKASCERSEILRLAMQEGHVSFDLFADLAAQLLSSKKIRSIVANAYPTIILDEFQDTADDQWRVIKALGRDCQLLALADPEQRIFGFLGADPERLKHFEEEFDVTKVDLGDTNHRSDGTELLLFGDDILAGKFSKNSYGGVFLHLYEPNHNQATAKLVSVTLKARERLCHKKKNWSLAILVPTKRMTRMVSDAFRSPGGALPEIAHHAVIDMEAAILAAEAIGYALQCHGGECASGEFVPLLSNYYRGKAGSSPTKTNLQHAARILRAHALALERRRQGKKVPKKSIFLRIESAFVGLERVNLIGNPDRDFLAVRSYFESVESKELNEIAADARNLRLLDRGTELRQSLSQNWREEGGYSRALAIVRDAYLRHHFATSAGAESGVLVMNMHKAKGRQFDEVIIFEGWPRFKKKKVVANPDRIVRSNLRTNVDVNTRQNFRVSITRAKSRATVLTPRGNPCVLLTSENAEPNVP